MLYWFKAIRWLIGGRWGAVTGYFWGKRWVRMSSESLELPDEIYADGWPWQRVARWFARMFGGSKPW